MKKFNFNHESSNSHDFSIAKFMEGSLGEFDKIGMGDGGVENKQLCFIISDGKMNKEIVRPYMKEARKKDVTYVFIIIDSQENSILKTTSLKEINDDHGKRIRFERKPYLSNFPFEYFLIVRGVKELGDVLASTLLQFIQ